MSKAEERALKEYPYKEGYDVELPYPSTYDENKDQREAYIKGYHQAEKDLELTVDDIKDIDKLLNQCVDCNNPYQEVLKRFKEMKKNDTGEG